MMYSENGESDVYYLDSSSIDTVDGGEMEAERMIEDDEPSRYHTLYAALFSTPGCPFEQACATRPTEGRHRKRDLMDYTLTGLLSHSTLVTECAKRSAAVAPTRAPRPQMLSSSSGSPPAETVDTQARECIPCEDGSYYEAHPSRVSRFLAQNLGQCILLPVSTDTNRASLKASHAGDPIELPELHIAYRGRDAAGWALPLTVDAATVAYFKTRYSAWRAATAEDVCLFAKWIHVKGTSTPGSPPANSAATQNPAPSLSSLSQYVAHHNASVDTLLRIVAAAGGWRSVIFVAVDVEAFTVLKGGEPLPAEVHMHTCGYLKKDPVEEHFFVHPGHVDLSLLPAVEFTSTQVHFIPYEGAPFLFTDYAALAGRLRKSVLRRKEVILINKGSIMDVEALLWIFAAAALQRMPPDRRDEVTASPTPLLTVPTLDQLACFDIVTLRAALAQSFPEVNATEEAAAATRPVKERVVRACRYHRLMREAVVAQGFLYDDDFHMHCAREDSRALRNDVDDLLYAYGVAPLSEET